jgi:hypothetical protein
VDIDPMERADATDSADSKQSAVNARLNTYVALTVALLATFVGICKVKDDNIVQEMQQAQADKLDHWSFYQARNVRQEVAEATVAELAAARAHATGADAATIDAAVAHYHALAADQAAKKDTLQRQAIADQQRYDALNYRDDQFDLTDTLVALAISLLALTALTHKRWLYWVAIVPTALGVLMGLAGLLGWHIHPDAITRWLS